MGFLHDASEKRLTADDLDEAKRAVGQLPVIGGGRITSHATPGGTVVGLGGRPNTESSVYVGRIIATETGDFDDERYYVAIQTPVGGENDTQNLLFSEGNAEHDPSVVVAHNVAEWADGGGTHSLPSDGTRYVKVTAVEDHAGTTRWVMSEGGTAGIVVKVTATKGTGGQYDGTVMSGTLTPAGTGTYALPGALTAGASVLVVNDDEYGNATHWVELNSYAEGVYGGTSTEGTPRPVVRIQRGKYRTASPTTIGSSAERTTASSDTWNRTTSDTPLERWVCTGVYYDDAAGTPALKAHMVKDTYAADGRLHSTTAETDYTIDTPDSACA